MDKDHPRSAPPLDLTGSSIVLDDEAEGYLRPNPLRSAMPVLALLLAVGWVAAACWLARGSIAAMAWPARIEFAAAVASVPALVGIVRLLTRRDGRTEALRFGVTAAELHAETTRLERTAASLGAALDANREKLAAQGRSFEALGDDAVERLARAGTGLSTEIAAAERHAAALATIAIDAQARLGEILHSLPLVRAETVEATGMLERATASGLAGAAALAGQVTALTERARDADALATTAAARLATHLADMERTGDAAGARLEVVTGEATVAVDGLLDRTARAVDESRRSIAAQGEAMLAMVGAHQATLDHAARDSAEALATRIELVEVVIERVAKRLDAQRTAGDAMVASFDAAIGSVETRLDALHAQGVDRSQQLAASLTTLVGSADAMTDALRKNEATARGAIGTANALLVTFDASAREIDETLPLALDRLDARVAQSRRVVGQAKPELLALVTAAESTHDAIEAIAQVIAGQRGALDRLTGSLLETLATGQDKADALGATVDGALARADRFAGEAAPRLLEALLRVRDTANAAADKARDALASVIPEAAGKLEAAGSAALARAAGVSVDRRVAAIADAADAAVASANRASDRVAERLRELTDTSAGLDARFADARADREELDRDSFAHRASQLIEQLNSASIDITKTFAPEVTDTAWAAYLKGDHGVFTRRAVRLLNTGEAGQVARHYDADPTFREQVNRYIHDFEAMLRTVLAQRDGSPLGVTLLSSDMGKLYVALAQAIERLR